MFGGTKITRDEERLRQRIPDILVATPGRLNDHLTNGGLASAMSELRVLVLDEADRLLDMGFRCAARAPASSGIRDKRLGCITTPCCAAVLTATERLQAGAGDAAARAAGQADAADGAVLGDLPQRHPEAVRVCAAAEL